MARCDGLLPINGSSYGWFSIEFYVDMVLERPRVDIGVF